MTQVYEADTASQALGARRSLPSPGFSWPWPIPPGDRPPLSGGGATALDRIGMGHLNPTSGGKPSR